MLSVRVRLVGAQAGVFTLEDDRTCSFSYDQSYQFANGATPLSRSIPLTRQHHRGSAVLAYLDNLLPDNPSVRQQWAQQYGVSPDDPLALLHHNGEDVSGALQFEQVRDAIVIEEGRALRKREIAARIREAREDSRLWLDGKNRGRFSLAGAQAKLTLRQAGKRWWFSTPDQPSTHIFKFGVRDWPNSDLNEFVCGQLAARLGLYVAPSELVLFEDERAVVVQRFDRRAVASSVERQHSEDLCQALGVRSLQKFESTGGPSAAAIINLLRQNPRMAEREHSVDRFVDTLIFNWLIVGTDAHAKNYSLLLRGSDFALAPLYDLISFLPFTDDAANEALAMSIGGNTRVGAIGRPQWEEFASANSLDAESLLTRAKAMCDRTPEALDAALSLLPAELEPSDFANDFRRRMVERANDCRRRLR